MTIRLIFSLAFVSLLCVSLHAAGWKRHAIDSTSRGADGVRPMDVNNDGRPDLCTGWEEGGVIRVYLHPGKDDVTGPWPKVTVGKVASPEDAVFVDLNLDGAIDVVSACEGKQRELFVHWAPTSPADYLNEMAWRTEPLPGSHPTSMWMFSLPWPKADHSGIDLISGAKGNGAAIGRLVQAENTQRWNWQPIVDAGWIMSLEAEDINGDGKADLVYSDRKGKTRGVFWIDMANPDKPGKPQLIGGANQEVMFLDVADFDADGKKDVVVAMRSEGILVMRRTSDEPMFEPIRIPLPPNTGGGKSVRIGDIDSNGTPDLVFSCEHSENKHGVMWLSRSENSDEWTPHQISGDKDGIKFDLLQLIDLDEDGDLDVLTCEERDNLGVIWYENPLR